MGYSISIFVVILFFLLMGYFYVEITGKIKIPEQRVYKELEEIIKNRYNDAWQIKDLVRDIGGPNYDPKIFRVVLQDRKIKDLSFSFYWNAVEKEVHFYYSESSKHGAIQTAYEKAFEIYDMKRNIRSRLDKRVKKIEFSHFHFTVFLDFEPDYDFITVISTQILRELEQYAHLYPRDMSLKFSSPLEPEGLYEIRLRNSIALSKSNFSGLKNCAITLNASSNAVKLISKLVINELSDHLKADKNLKFAPRSPFTWLHQKNLNEVYLLYFLQDAVTINADDLSYSGFLLVKSNLNNSEISSYRIVSKEYKNLRKALDTMEADLPDYYLIKENK